MYFRKVAFLILKVWSVFWTGIGAVTMCVEL